MNKLFEIEKEVHDESFQNNENDTFICDCRKVNKINFKNNLIMLKSHKYFTVSLLWTEPPKFEDICRIFITFPQRFKNTDLFHVYNDFDIKDYVMQGLIVSNNFNNHVSFFINDEINNESYEKIEWFCCNDNETKIMPSYKDVIEWSLTNNFYPILLFYMYLDKDKIKEAKNIEFTPEQLNTYIHHCTLIDHMNSITYTNYKLKKEKLHPDIKDIFISDDGELYEKINEIKQDETKINKKFNFVEELEKEKEKEAMEEIIHKEEEENEKESEKRNIHIKRPKNISKFNQSKNDYLFNKGIESETFRKYPYKREGDWVCSNCDNINNSSTFECVKCKYINMDIFARIDEEKNAKSKEVKKTLRNLKSFKKNSPPRKNLEYNQYTKKCLNCGNYYIKICYRCQKNNNDKYKVTFSQIRDENDMDQVKFVYNRDNRTIKNQKKIKEKEINELVKEWECKYCRKVNSSKNTFCVNCKFNK